MESLYRVIIDTVMDGTDIDEEEMRKLLEEKGVDFSDYEDKVDRLLYEDN